MVNISFEISDDQLGDIQRLFPGIEDAPAKLASMAALEWLGWLSGTSRPTTISEQNIQRIIDIYANIFNGEMPNAGKLFNVFNIPLGQSRYIIQAISYKKAGVIYAKAVKELLSELGSDELHIEEGCVKVRLQKNTADILIEVIGDLVEQNQSLSIPKVRKIGNCRELELLQGDIEIINDRLSQIVEERE